MKFGTAMAAIISMIATTISSSIKENPELPAFEAEAERAVFEDLTYGLFSGMEEEGKAFAFPLRYCHEWLL